MKAIVTVIGKDSIGIIARVCTFLADREINIKEISQNVVGGYFNMMMIVEITRYHVPFEQVVEELEEMGQSIDVVIKVQREDIFTAMHRV